MRVNKYDNITIKYYEEAKNIIQTLLFYSVKNRKCNINTTCRDNSIMFLLGSELGIAQYILTDKS